MRSSVYHYPALTANTLTAVMIEFHRSLSLPDKPFVQRIQHFQE
jgi:hypothetical protein